MLLAVLLDREMRGSRFYQTAFYMPVVLSLALIGFIWQLFYSPRPGPAQRRSSAPQVDWYGDPNINLWAVLVADRWRHTGYVMLLYLAGPEGRRPHAARGRGRRRRQRGARPSSRSSSR